MKIFVWKADDSGVGEYRGEAPARALRDHGHHVDCNIRLPPDHHTYDVIVGMRVCNDGATKTWQRLAAAGDAKLVLELDDDLWHVDPSNRGSATWYQGDVLERLSRNVEISDAVTVSTAALAERVAPLNDNVHIVPNQIPAWLLDHERPAADLLTVGWRGGPSHDRDFGELAKPLRSWLQHPQQRGRVGFHAMGADYTGRVATRHGRTRHTPWMTEVSGFLRAVDFDAAVIPLRPSVFNDSKSELAVLEMSALGIPCAASATGPYRHAAAEGAPVLLATTPAQWRDTLNGLFDRVTGADTRKNLGEQAREWAKTRTYEANAHRWITAYES